MIPNLLVAVDGGKLTDRITAYALRIAKGTKLNFLCAVDPAGLMNASAALAYNIENDRADAVKLAQTVVNACVTKAEAAGIEAEGLVVEESPVKAILQSARQIDADLIIMASHGRSGFARFVLGSVAEGVMRAADIGVLIVPSGLPADDPARHLHQIFQGL
jgi:nucleotide-binding universal stress UspA family protein